MLERESRRGRDGIGEVDRFGVQRVGRPHRDRHAQRDVQCRVVAASRRSVDDVVVHERPEVQEFHRGCAADGSGSIATVGQFEHKSGSMARPGLRGGRKRVGNGVTETRDDTADQAIDVGQQDRLVRHGP